MRYSYKKNSLDGHYLNIWIFYLFIGECFVVFCYSIYGDIQINSLDRCYWRIAVRHLKQLVIVQWACLHKATMCQTQFLWKPGLWFFSRHPAIQKKDINKSIYRLPLRNKYPSSLCGLIFIWDLCKKNIRFIKSNTLNFNHEKMIRKMYVKNANTSKNSR